jgi:hypothetical protein
MVIVAPTALYNSVLPHDPSSNIPVTWIISSQDPPRTTTAIPLFPWGVEIEPLPKMIFNPARRQPDAGAFVFSVNYTNSSKVGSGDKQYESGQVLSFDDSITDTQDINTINIPEVIDLQQNTNILSLGKMGLTNEEITNFEIQTRTKMNTLITTINDVKSKINVKEVQIMDNQKYINETEKALTAASVVFDITDPIITKLQTNLNLLTEQRTILIDELNILITNVNSQYNLLLDVKEIVR